MANSDNRNKAAKSDGRFKPGNPGKPPGTRSRVTRAIEELMGGQHEALTQKAVELALEGDTVALRLCLDRLAPPRKDAPISIELPPVKTLADAVEASSAVLAAVAAGDCTPDEGGRLMAMLTAHRSIAETGDLEARIKALEERGER